MREAKFYERLGDGRVRCGLCNHHCELVAGGIGNCGVRVNQDGSLQTNAYGHTAALNIDPIEKKPLFHFLPGTLSLSIGTYGCNFRCDFCQNWELSQERSLPDTEPGNPTASQELPPQALVEHASRRGIPGISYTYNEPTVFMEYALETMELAKQAGLSNVFVSNGFMTEVALREAAPCLDAINIDLKSFNNDFYVRHCQARLKPVLDTILLAHELGIWVEVTTLIIPGENSDSAELKQIARFLAVASPETPWHVTAFHPDYRMQDTPHTPAGSLLTAYEIGREAGLLHVYVGNIFSTEHSSTYCPSCSKPVVQRAWGAPTANYLKAGACPVCGLEIAGVWA